MVNSYLVIITNVVELDGCNHFPPEGGGQPSIPGALNVRFAAPNRRLIDSMAVDFLFADYHSEEVR